MSVDSRPLQPNEVLIDGRFYDVTNFKHPGGSIIKFCQGQCDATEAFVEFHMHSTYAKKRLTALPSRPAVADSSMTPQEAARMKKLSKDFADLRLRLEKEGWFAPDYLHVAYRITELFALYALGAYLALTSPFWVLGIAILGIAEGRCGWAMHEGGHHSFTGVISIDQSIQEFLYGVGCGMSAAWWRVQHNKHHATPQKLKHDVDLDTLPLVSFNKAISAKAKNPVLKGWLRMQSILFVPVICSIISLFWQAYLHPRHMVRTKRNFELVSLAIRYSLWAFMTLHIAGLSVSGAIGIYFFHQFFGSAYIFTNFALSHSHLPVVDATKNIHWVEYASQHTIDITPHVITDWWMGYLNYQIEHHLFPEMPQYRFTKLHPQIRKLFKDNGLVYDCRDYWVAVGDTFRNLHFVGN
jgi:acyl-CoA 6-desaturase (Delta-6 desaturase)